MFLISWHWKCVTKISYTKSQKYYLLSFYQHWKLKKKKNIILSNYNNTHIIINGVFRNLGVQFLFGPLNSERSEGNIGFTVMFFFFWFCTLFRAERSYQKFYSASMDQKLVENCTFERSNSNLTVIFLEN